MPEGETAEGGVSHRVVCTACGLEADKMGVLDSGERVYIHGSEFCLARLEDTHGSLKPGVDQVRDHLEADA